MRRFVLPMFLAVLVIACGDAATDRDDEYRTIEKAARVCADGPTVPGIDVSRWQADIDWGRVARAGIEFAVIKSTQGTSGVDPKFADNWRDARAAGVLRGPYHFFCPELDGAAQADHMLDTVGELQADDLPPVLDVEVCSASVCGTSCDWDGLSCATIQNNIRRWADRVIARTGRTPMVYSNVGTWDSSVCGSDVASDLHLWVANWGASCPSVPRGWSDWVFWQTSDNGRVDGISGAVDLDLFNGDSAALRAFVGETGPACGDGRCEGDEGCESCPGDCGECPPPPDTGTPDAGRSDAGPADAGPSDAGRDTADAGPTVPCAPVGRRGAVVDELDPCFVRFGEDRWDPESPEGHAGHFFWVPPTAGPSPTSWARWELAFAEAGVYRLEIYVDGTARERAIRFADYTVRHRRVAEQIVVDQSAVDGWQAVAELGFDAGGDQYVELGDVPALSGPGDLVIFDAIRLAWVDDLRPRADAGVTDTVGPPDARPDASTDAAFVDAPASDGATDAGPGGVRGRDFDGSTGDRVVVRVRGCGVGASPAGGWPFWMVAVGLATPIRRARRSRRVRPGAVP